MGQTTDATIAKGGHLHDGWWMPLRREAPALSPTRCMASKKRSAAFLPVLEAPVLCVSVRMAEYRTRRRCLASSTRRIHGLLLVLLGLKRESAIVCFGTTCMRASAACYTAHARCHSERCVALHSRPRRAFQRRGASLTPDTASRRRQPSRTDRKLR